VGVGQRELIPFQEPHEQPGVAEVADGRRTRRCPGQPEMPDRQRKEHQQRRRRGRPQRPDQAEWQPPASRPLMGGRVPRDRVHAMVPSSHSAGLHASGGGDAVARTQHGQP
jgi:hypothetical protein